MAGDWIKFESSTSDKPEVWMISDLLGIDPDAVEFDSWNNCNDRHAAVQ